MSTDIFMMQDNLLPLLDHPCTLNDEPVNLSGAESILFRFFLQNGGPSREGPCTANAAPNEHVAHYVWQPGDTAVPGVYYAQITAVLAGKPITFPNYGYFRMVITAKIPAPVVP